MYVGGRALFFQMMQRRTSIASIPEPPPFEVWKLLWSQLEKLVHPAEIFEIQQIIGNSLIQENQVRKNYQLHTSPCKMK